MSVEVSFEKFKELRDNLGDNQILTVDLGNSADEGEYIEEMYGDDDMHEPEGYTLSLQDIEDLEEMYGDDDMHEDFTVVHAEGSAETGYASNITGDLSMVDGNTVVEYGGRKISLSDSDSIMR